MPDEKKRIPLMVTGAHDGQCVFFGFADSMELDDRGGIILYDAQNCLWWEGVHGLGELAARGPGAKCRIGPPVRRMWVSDVRTVTECSGVAVQAWAREPW